MYRLKKSHRNEIHAVLLILKSKYKKKMSAVSVLNPKAEIARASHSLAINISAAKGLQEILKSNLGPKGTMKM